MPRSGTGTFSLVAGNPRVTGTIISSTVENNTNNDIAQALTQSIASTGVTVPTANLPMGGFRHTGVGNANAQGCYTSVTDVQNGSAVTLSSLTGTNDIVATAPFTPVAYAAGQTWKFAVAATNTGPVTINISGLGVKNVTKFGATLLAAGDLAVGSVQEITYDGVEFQLVNARQGAGVGALVVNARSANTSFNINDLGSLNLFTTTFTQTFDAAATLGAGWYVDVENNGTGVITFDANGTETFQTGSGPLTAISLYPGEGYRITCNGAGFQLLGRAAEVELQAPQTASNSVVDFEQGFTDAEFSAIKVVFSSVLVGSTSMALRVKKAGAYVNGATYATSITFANGAAALNLTGQNLGAVTGVNSTSTQEISGECIIYRPTDSTGNSGIFCDSAVPEVGAQAYRMLGGTYEPTSLPIQGVRFLTFSATGLTAGKFSIYGIRG